eukprot:scaffold2557_cov363-Pavlova_lutheri.AAC.1
MGCIWRGTEIHALGRTFLSRIPHPRWPRFMGDGIPPLFPWNERRPCPTGGEYPRATFLQRGAYGGRPPSDLKRAPPLPFHAKVSATSHSYACKTRRNPPRVGA